MRLLTSLKSAWTKAVSGLSCYRNLSLQEQAFYGVFRRRAITDLDIAEGRIRGFNLDNRKNSWRTEYDSEAISERGAASSSTKGTTDN
jgi:hypothetical protein